MNIITAKVDGIEYFRDFDGLWFYRKDGYTYRQFDDKELERQYAMHIAKQRQTEIREDWQENNTGLGTNNMKRQDVVEHYKTKALIQKLERQLEHSQQLIDRLMLEYCPDEMTEEQIKNWEEHQVKSDIGAGSGG